MQKSTEPINRKKKKKKRVPNLLAQYKKKTWFIKNLKKKKNRETLIQSNWLPSHFFNLVGVIFF